MKCLCGNDCFSFLNVSTDTKTYTCYRTSTICDISRGHYSEELSKKPPCNFYKEIDKEGNILQDTIPIQARKNKEKFETIVDIQTYKIKKYKRAPIKMDIQLDTEEEQIFLNLLYSEGNLPKTLSEQSKKRIFILILLCKHDKYIYTEIKKLISIKSNICEKSDSNLPFGEEQSYNSDEELEDEELQEYMEIEEDSDSDESETQEEIIYDL